ncbi:MAG: hypothetical protein IKI03_04275 [Clostridia bacterium]|nr:hypothetical protein [Clostridia bacterium]
MKKKIIAMLLVSVFVAACFAGCAKKNDTKATESESVPVESAQNTESEEVTGIRAHVDELASEVDYNGKSFVYMGGQSVNFPTKEEETGEITSDALYYRQRDIVSLFGVDWENVNLEGSEEAKQSMIDEVMAGGDSYDLVNGFVRSVGRPTLNAGVLREVQDLETIDLDQIWWNQSIRTNYSLRGKLYFLMGPINVYNYLDTHVVIFNKRVTHMFGINDADIYQSVKDGKWTIDKMFAFAEAIPENGTGKGVYKYAYPEGLPFLFGAGYTITHFDEDGVPYVESTLPREYSDLADKIVPVFADPAKSAFENPKNKEDFEEKYGMTVEDLFNSDLALFMFPETAAAQYMRSYDVPFGILPIPKLTEGQSEYYCSASSWSTGAVYILKTARDVEMISRITEAMAALSQIYVKDAYYDKLLKAQSIFDLESAEMLDIIFSSKIYDMADLYCGGDIDNLGDYIKILVNGFTYDNSNLASDYRANARIVAMNIKEMMRTLDNN